MARTRTPSTNVELPAEVRAFLSSIGKKGGQRSRRALSSRQAKEMVQVREARRAFNRYHAQCFWSYDPGMIISIHDVPWIAQTLKKNGNREAWEIAEKLCR